MRQKKLQFVRGKFDMEKIWSMLVGLVVSSSLLWVTNGYATPPTWQDAGTQSSTIPEEVTRVRNIPPSASPITPPIYHESAPKIIYASPTHSITALTFYSGSLRENIQRVAKECGWGVVVWKTPYDYNWIGTAHFADGHLPTILHRVLDGYPLQAVFYQGNHILVIIPRNIT